MSTTSILALCAIVICALTLAIQWHERRWLRREADLDRLRRIEGGRFKCAVCKVDMSGPVKRMMGGPPPADEIIATCPNGHACIYHIPEEKA